MKVQPARTMDDMMKVMVIRGIVFVGEQRHSYNMEFDANEFNNRIHLIAYDEEEPIGTMRILKDGQDAKFERLAVLPSYRGKGISAEIIEAGYEYCRQLDVDRVFLFCKPELENFWYEQGYQKVAGDKVLKNNFMTLVPVMKRLNPETSPEKENLTQIPKIMSRQKGEWISRPDSKIAVILKNRDRHRQ